jgi:soluble lytic murein transglycosylase
LDYSKTVEKATKGIGINNSLVMSLTRQESAFNERARSPVGAMGLMQLMPATAKQVSKSIGLNFSSANLYDKETNLRLGSSYLDQLIDHYKGNAILATAAYNAGPNRVDKWLDEAPNCQRIDTWIESIPYKETRQYVQNVLAYKVIYDTLQGKPTRLMAPGQEILGAAVQFSAND